MRFATPMRQSERRAVFTGIALVLLFVLAGCQAPLEQKRGATGELCNGQDTQCREGLVCEKGVCQSINNSEDVCPQICDKFADCNAGMTNCYRNCMATLRDWSEEVTDTYADCYENEVSCTEIQDSNAPQNICYAELELDEVREERCQTLRDTASACLAGAGDYEDQIDNFYDSCRRRGRTVSNSRWEATETCEDHATADGGPRCDGMFACINDNFRLDKDFPEEDPTAE